MPRRIRRLVIDGNAGTAACGRLPVSPSVPLVHASARLVYASVGLGHGSVGLVHASVGPVYGSVRLGHASVGLVYGSVPLLSPSLHLVEARLHRATLVIGGVVPLADIVGEKDPFAAWYEAFSSIATWKCGRVPADQDREVASSHPTRLARV